ncbi:MAG: hypothetical protein JWM68_1839 [Verrucomicrobiales bacterium]|nr:hypothetical protein [Verrucomicrobiales bacterium]
MLTTHPLPIECEKCHTDQSFVMRVRVDAVKQPQDKEDLISGKLNTFVCPKCRFTKVYDCPLWYEDKKKNLMVLVVPSFAQIEHRYPPPGIRKTTQLRTVTTRNQLIEKIFLRDARLDDRVIEYLKVQMRTDALRRSIPVDGNLMFTGVELNDDGEPVLQFQDFTGASDDEFLGVSLNHYKHAAKALKPFIARIPVPDILWQTVDRNYGKQLEQFVDKEIEKLEKLEKPQRNKRSR